MIAFRLFIGKLDPREIGGRPAFFQAHKTAFLLSKHPDRKLLTLRPRTFYSICSIYKSRPEKGDDFLSVKHLAVC